MRVRIEPTGTPFHGELESADISTAALIPIYDSDNNAISEIGANERLVIEQASIVSKTAVDDVEIYQGSGASSGAGETITYLDAGATGGIQFLGRRVCKAGVILLKAKAGAAADVKVIVNGYIQKG